MWENLLLIVIGLLSGIGLAALPRVFRGRGRGRGPQIVRTGGSTPQALSALLQEREGMALARNVTGGDGQTSAVVTNGNDSGAGSLRAAAETNNRYITFSGDITVTLTAGSIALADNVTIDGQGNTIIITTDGSFNAATINANDATNWIIADVEIRNVGAGSAKDCIMVQGGSDQFWIHHVTFSDAGDEFIDISAKDVTTPTNMDGTVSWCKFTGAYGSGCVGIGHTVAQEANNQYIRVSLGHNWYDGANSTGGQPQRMPFTTDGVKVHCWNNYCTMDAGGLALHEYRDNQSVVTELRVRGDYLDVENGTSNFDDWIHTYNSDSSSKIDLAECFLSASATTPGAAPTGGWDTLTVTAGGPATAVAKLNAASVWDPENDISGYSITYSTMTTTVRDNITSNAGARTT